MGRGGSRFWHNIVAHRRAGSLRGPISSMPPKAGCSSTVGQRTKIGGQTGQPRATTTPVEVEALPHRGYVEVDNFTGAQPLLVHNLTLERVPLPEGG